MVCDFKKIMGDIDPQLLEFDSLQTLQVNLGNRCNQSCAHCHVQAGPKGKNIMNREVMEKIIGFLGKHRGLCIDITGGCPELNPCFKYFVESVYSLVSQMIVRTNLTVFFEPGLDWVPDWYAGHGVVVAASLPCYTQENVDKQRGGGVFEKSIKALKMLNELGYGYKRNLELHLIYNPGAGLLPGPQQQLEQDYKKNLKEEFGIQFNKLFTITNAPIGRFRKYLEANGQLEQYVQLLVDNFNSDTATGIMCRTLLSVDFRGMIYNCDFNQASGLPVIDSKGRTATIDNLHDILAEGFNIIVDKHCFCCTAGAGSSCTGSLVKG